MRTEVGSDAQRPSAIGAADPGQPGLRAFRSLQAPARGIIKPIQYPRAGLGDGTAQQTHRHDPACRLHLQPPCIDHQAVNRDRLHALGTSAVGPAAPATPPLPVQPEGQLEGTGGVLVPAVDLTATPVDAVPAPVLPVEHIEHIGAHLQLDVAAGIPGPGQRQVKLLEADGAVGLEAADGFIATAAIHIPAAQVAGQGQLARQAQAMTEVAKTTEHQPVARRPCTAETAAGREEPAIGGILLMHVLLG